MIRSICIPCAPPVDITGFDPLLEHPLFQALRYRKQLGLNDLAFPGAVHTRFEHALGVLALTQRLCRIQNLSGDDVRHLQAFALLHDIGHGPFSHQVEPVLPGDHHANGIHCLEEMRPSLEKARISLARLVRMLAGQDELAGFVSDRNLGADKLDYLARDAFHIGFHGTPDIERIQCYTVFAEGKLAIEERFVEDIKQLQKFYSYLHQHGYLNKTALAAQRMLQRACQEELLLAPPGTAENIWREGDGQLLARLSAGRSALARALVERLQRRELYHSFLVLKPTGYGWVERVAGKPICVQERPRSELRSFCERYADLAGLRELEDKLADAFGLAPGEILFAAMPYFRKLIPRDVQVFASGEQVSYSLFEKDADHRRSLESDYLRTFAVRLVCPIRHRERLARLAEMEDVLGGAALPKNYQ